MFPRILGCWTHHGVGFAHSRPDLREAKETGQGIKPSAALGPEEGWAIRFFLSKSRIPLCEIRFGCVIQDVAESHPPSHLSKFMLFHTRVLRSLHWALLLGASLCAMAICPAAGGEVGEAEQLEVSLGIGGAWKLGHVCPVRVTIPKDVRSAASVIEVDTVDGDGVEVTYRQALRSPVEQLQWVPVRIGRRDAELRVHVLDAQGTQLAKRTIESTQSRGGLSSDQPLVLALGSAMGVDKLSRSNADGTDSTFTTTVVTSAEQLPPSWRDYTACDILLISSQDLGLLQEIPLNKWRALDTWIRRGGGCILSLGCSSAESAQELARIEGLQQLLPGEITGVGQVSDPGALETLVSTDEPIRRFPVTLLSQPLGKVELSFSDTLTRPVPWWISGAHGQGTIRALASDMDHEAFASWSDRRLLWGLLLQPYLDRSILEGTKAENPVRDSSYLGYSDLVGQLRATLDVFTAVKVVTFGQVSALLVGILLLVGPLDYLVVVKWLKRPDWSWYFAGGLLVVISIGLTWLHGTLRPDEVRINTVQIVDIDGQTGAANGRLWAHVYAGDAHRVNVEAKSNRGTSPVLLDWQGLPGRGLGGLLSQIHSDRGMPNYEIEIDAEGQSSFRQVGIPAAGTKCLSGGWVDQLELAAHSDLREIPGVDQLTGELTNPLTVDIRDAMLLYHNWYYRLDSRIPAGATVSISLDTIPKDLARRLNQRRTIDGKGEIAKWDPSDRHSIDRLLELMMFHKAAAGTTYTSLTHRYQPHVDHSNLLETDHAILVGRLDEPLVSVGVDFEEGVAPEVKQDLNRVWCRIAIPVQK